ncbi:hypothetical protein [Virgibacillus subterraneus]|uniref:hypothetical protein n=1 Tax=Virgibacillus subterraneus TaxID=621109 RepID=UPI001FDEAF09|nr:hypothetical protein [Virgibacillus subterraneus]
MLTSVQPRSTIMPEKVNPAILEMTHLVCYQVIDYETAIATEINVVMPIIAHTFIHSIDLLSNSIQPLEERYIRGINEKQCKKWMEESLALVTGLSSIMEYDMASQMKEIL